MEDSRAFPLQQGDLDWLCSLYATINLLYLHKKISALEEADQQFRALITGVLPTLGWDLGRYIALGVDPDQDILDLLKGVGFRKIEYFEPTVLAIATACRETPGVLIYFSERPRPNGTELFSHYTIVTSVSDAGELELYDSRGLKPIKQVCGRLHTDRVPIKIIAAWRISG